MTKSFGCSDVGVNCNWTTTADSEEDIMKKIKEHANNVHGFKEIPQDLEDKVKSAIKEQQ
jgi:predicted small metal-binding protein